MFKFKIFSSIIIFSILLIVTSFIKNQTRDIEKKILNINQIVSLKEKDISETQLDFSYLASPSMIEQKINYLDNLKYIPMDYSRIFLNISVFLDLDKKFVTQKKENEKKIK